jgi:hypothetical protein
MDGSKQYGRLNGRPFHHPPRGKNTIRDAIKADAHLQILTDSQRQTERENSPPSPKTKNKTKRLMALLHIVRFDSCWQSASQNPNGF